MGDDVTEAVKELADALSTWQNAAPTGKQILSLRHFAERIDKDQILAALHRAFTGSNVENPWNYFCGICLRVISRSTRGSIGESVESYGKFPWS